MYQEKVESLMIGVKDITQNTCTTETDRKKSEFFKDWALKQKKGRTVFSEVQNRFKKGIFEVGKKQGAKKMHITGHKLKGY